MQFGQAVRTACATFAITNIDHAFVLVTFFAEAATSKTLTPAKITIGQYVGFTIMMIISMIGFAVSLVLPSEPIGFLGLLPMLLGIWKLLEILVPAEEVEPGNAEIQGLKSIIKIAVYVVVYYILLGVWCLVGFLVTKQKHILRLLEKYVAVVIPFLYMGLGVYIVVKSACYPWSIERIDDSSHASPGKGILAGVTVFLILVSAGTMIWVRWFRSRTQSTTDVEITSVRNH
ncbi:putative Cadmium resistance transporter [Seiridium unicorne]|uniref:Cadmium resistance transporter n=1 Tax=Seiridium unicorne TaxID=138068 RepID=A0ABR2UVF7_9PEZI